MKIKIFSNFDELLAAIATGEEGYEISAVTYWNGTILAFRDENAKKKFFKGITELPVEQQHNWREWKPARIFPPIQTGAILKRMGEVGIKTEIC